MEPITPWQETAFHRPKLLIVDDQNINLRVLHDIFRHTCEVFMATNGEQALQKCRDIMPDLILMDIEMPGMNGFEACAELKKEQAIATIPVIFITGHITEQDEIRGFELGAVDFIRKPINPLITQIRVNTHLKLKQQSDLLKSIAMLDSLTGIANRRQFEETLAMDWLQCAREQKPLSLILLDIDFFKQYNDHYGHSAGDDCLRQVASNLHKLIQRPYDLVARFGGEEFVVILPATDLEGATHLAQKMVSGIASLGIEHQRSSISNTVTISAGVASLIPNNELEPDLLVQTADQELYRAKRKGRNQCSASPIYTRQSKKTD
jgi:diguanylate cyclase (GGDEF)-like protein